MKQMNFLKNWFLNTLGAALILMGFVFMYNLLTEYLPWGVIIILIGLFITVLGTKELDKAEESG